ncbi:MAG: hypothetical protein PHX08_01155 [Lachnospiraceae bacterium]|nr:hypothetical protein [Lachnospiraceae bacterium]
MNKVKIYIETTLKKACIKDGQYAAIIEFEKKNGEIATKTIFGVEKETTYHRSTLLACVETLELLNVPCEVSIHISDFIVSVTGGCKDLKKCPRKEWEAKDLWKRYTEQLRKHEVTIEQITDHKYSKYLTEGMRRQ